MRYTRYKLHCTLVLDDDRRAPEFARWLLGSIPSHSTPKYFSRTELLRRRPEYEVANSEALERYLTSQQIHWFHCDGLVIDTGANIRHRREVSLFSRSVERAARLLYDWVPSLDEEGLYYATAGAPSEFDHRNGLIVTLANHTGGVANLWVGRDYERYVPGLYWLNYFSRRFITTHGLDMEHLRQGLNADVRELRHGYLVLLYNEPGEWEQSTEQVDDFLFSARGYFSKRRVNATPSVPTMELVPLISRLGKEWP